MDEIRSGSSTRRVVRAVLGVVMINLFAVLFLWDGYLGYPVKNAAQLARTLGVPLPVPPPILEPLTAERAGAWAQSLQDASPADVEKALGPPAFFVEGAAYYLGPGGHLAVTLADNQVRKVEWQPGVHSERDIQWQRVLGAVMAAMGVISLVNLMRVVLSFATLSSKGLHVSGRRMIPWSDMTGLAVIPQDKFGRWALTYRSAGVERRLLLDDYHIRDRDAIVSAISARLKPSEGEAANPAA